MKHMAEELCGTEISSTQMSRCAKILDGEIVKFRNRPLGQIEYLFLDAQYEKFLYEGCVRPLAVLKAIGVNKEGYREVLDVSCSFSEARVHFRFFLDSLMKRGMNGTYLVTSDDHLGLKAALKAALPSVPWQRSLSHLAQNAGVYAPSKLMKAELCQSVREIYQASDRQEAE
jgi:putative transposase